jgi:hypothetical protein
MKTVRRMIGTMLVLSIAICFATTVRAADSAGPGSELPVLKLVPEDALGIVLFNHLDKVDEQIGKLAQETQIPSPSLLPLLKMLTGIQVGLDEHGSSVLALMPADAAGAAPIAVIFVPVSDYRKFVGQLKPDDASAEIAEVSIGGKAHAIAHKGGFAVVVGKANKDMLKKVLSSSRNVTPVIGALAGWMSERAISFVATPSGVKLGVAAARKGLAQMKAVFANSNEPTMKMTAGNLDFYDSFLQFADKEINQFAIGWHVDIDGGLHIDSRTVFVAGGSWATAAGGVEAPPGDRLTCLPGGPFMLAFDGAMPKSFAKGMLNMSVDMINNMSKTTGGKELTEEQSKQLNGLMEKAMAGVHSMSMVMGPPKPGGSMYSNMAAVMKVTNSSQYMADYQEAMEKISDIIKATGGQFPFVQEIKKAKINGDEGLELTMDMSAMFKNLPNNPASTKMLQMMFGSGGKMTAYIVPIDGTTVAISYINSDNIARVKAACQNPQSSLAADADIAQTAKLLAPGAQWVGYLSPKGFTDFISAFMSSALPPGAAPTIPAFPQTPPIGFAAEQSSKGLDLQLIIPGAALKGIGDYVKQLSGPKAPPRAQRAPPPRVEKISPVRTEPK